MLHAAATFYKRANGLLPTFGPVRSAHPESVVRNVSASLDPVVIQLGPVRSLKKNLRFILLNSSAMLSRMGTNLSARTRNVVPFPDQRRRIALVAVAERTEITRGKLGVILSS